MVLALVRRLVAAQSKLEAPEFVEQALRSVRLAVASAGLVATSAGQVLGTLARIAAASAAVIDESWVAAAIARSLLVEGLQRIGFAIAVAGASRQHA